MKSTIYAEDRYFTLSLPSRECGLKFRDGWEEMLGVLVTPFAGVWIEINMTDIQNAYQGVTPFAGVWIEIVVLTPVPMHVYRHSLRGSVD